MNPSTSTTLITGASSGIGLELARQFACHGHPVILIAPVEEELRAIGEEFVQKYETPTRIIAADLSEPAAAQQIYDGLAAGGIEVEILVNNAGLGQKGKFWEIPLAKDLEMIRVNLEAVVSMMKYFLPPMLARSRGKVLNVASIAGFQPGPNLAVYHATKAFVLSLSEAVATELQGTGVSMTALCPGAVDTDFFPKAGMVETRIFQQGSVMAPQEVAAAGYDALMRGERVYVPGAVNKAMAFSRRVLPESAQAKINQEIYEDVEPDKVKRHSGEIAAKER